MCAELHTVDDITPREAVLEPVASSRSVSMKINTKLGGMNVKLAGLRTPAGSAWPAKMGSKPFMILGAVRFRYRPPSNQLHLLSCPVTIHPVLLPCHSVHAFWLSADMQCIPVSRLVTWFSFKQDMDCRDPGGHHPS